MSLIKIHSQPNRSSSRQNDHLIFAYHPAFCNWIVKTTNKGPWTAQFNKIPNDLNGHNYLQNFQLLYFWFIIMLHKQNKITKSKCFDVPGQYSYNEVLNLTQDHHQLTHRQQLPLNHGNIQQQQMHHGMQQQQYPAFIQNSSLEVGLNLSLQKSFTGSHQQQQHQQPNGYYQQYDSGYTFSLQMGSNTAQVKFHAKVDLKILFL